MWLGAQCFTNSISSYFFGGEGGGGGGGDRLIKLN